MQKKEGFTLIEIVVVMAIIVIMSSILVSYTRQSGKHLLLTTTEAKLLSTISRAKFLSIDTFTRQSDTEGGCGFGVHIDSNLQETFIFQDKKVGDKCPGNGIYDEGERVIGELNTVKIDKRIFSMSVSGTAGDILFVPPDPDVFIDNIEASPGEKAIIIVKAKDESGEFTVSVNGFGQIRTE